MPALQAFPASPLPLPRGGLPGRSTIRAVRMRVRGHRSTPRVRACVAMACVINGLGLDRAWPRGEIVCA